MRKLSLSDWRAPRSCSTSRTAVEEGSVVWRCCVIVEVVEIRVGVGLGSRFGLGIE